jgi:hypothetical protein
LKAQAGRGWRCINCVVVAVVAVQDVTVDSAREATRARDGIGDDDTAAALLDASSAKSATEHE